MKKHRHHRFFQTSLAVLALGASGLLVYQNTGDSAKLATAPAVKSRSDQRDLASKTPHASKPQGNLPEITPPSAAPHLFQEFNDWAVQYAKATPAEQQQMLATGETMVKARHEQMVGLIEKSPQVALYESDALSPLAKDALPESLKAQLEQPVNARGDLKVMAYNIKGMEPYKRFAELDGQEYTVYPAGNNETLHSESNRSLLGIKLSVNRTTTTESGKQYPRVEKVLALRDKRVRILSTEEVAVAAKALQKGAVPVCDVSKQNVTVNKTPAAIETGGDTKWLCGPSHATAWLQTPEGINAERVPAGYFGAGIPGSGTGGYWPLPENWSTNVNGAPKTYFCVRFLCKGQTTTIFENVGALLQPMLDQVASWSYGRISFTATLAPGYIQLTKTAAEYIALGRDAAMVEARALALIKYPNLENYSFRSYCIQGVWAGGGFASMVGKDCMIADMQWKSFQHELGHNLGLPHLNLWEAATSDVLGAGTWLDYRGNFDMMSEGFGSFVTMSKFYLRWLKAEEMHDLGFRAAGNFTIYDPDVLSINPTRKYCVSIPKSDGSFYFVEFRPRASALVGEPGVGKIAVNDENLNGIRIMRTDRATMLDLKPGVGYRPDRRAYNNTLLPGEEFYDPAEGIRIKAIAKGGFGLDQNFQVQVSYTSRSVISGHCYTIHSQNNGYFLVGVNNSSGDNGGQVAQQYQAGTRTPNQKWMLMESSLNSNLYRIINMNSKKILEIGGNSMVNGGIAQQWDYVGSPSQLWKLVPTYFGYFKLINYRSGLALTVPYPLTQSGIQLQQYTDQNSVNQQWSFDEVNPLTSGANYVITARHSGKSMNPTSMDDLAAVVQAPTLNNFIYQKWTSATQGGAIQALTNAGTSRALQVGRTNAAYKYGQEDGEQVTQKAYSGDAWQKWTVVAVDLEGGDFWYRLVNVGSGLSADIGGVSTLDNAPVSQYSYQGGPNQHWRFKLAP